MYHCLRIGEYCHADVNSIADFQLFGGRRPCLPRPSAQMYQSAFGLVRDERERWNHGCWSEVWFSTRSNMTRIPRAWTSSIRRTASSRVPYSCATAS